MSDLAWVLAVICFWAFVACVVGLLVRMTAFSHDDEDLVCELDQHYFDEQLSGTTMAPAT
jgi:hypothetical protein